MKFFIFFLLILTFGCDRLYQIQYNPPQKASEWCIEQPCIEINNIIFSQPTSSLLVFILAFQTIFAGYQFLKKHQKQKSRKWWGYSLLFTGIGAFLAGISYQLLGYELKCRSSDYCNWTNWFEIYYNLTTVIGAGTLLVAVAYSSMLKKWVKRVKIIALIQVFTYTLLCLIGAFTPIQFLISYEFLVIFSSPIYILFLFINGYQYLTYKKLIYKHYLILWVSIFTIIGIYFTYLNLKLTDILWSLNIWFSANDILHVLMIFWILYIQMILNPYILDRK